MPTVAFQPAVTTTARTATIPTAPSSGRTRGQVKPLDAAAMEKGIPIDASSSISKSVPVPCDDEPNLYKFPSNVSPVYRPLPLAGKLLVAVVSILVSSVSTWHRIWLHPVVALRSGKSLWNSKKGLQFILKALLAGMASRAILQEAFLAPSRIDTSTLLQEYFLPSSLSRYETMQVPSGDESPSSVGVHLLRYKARRERSARFDVLYVNHGFGASSLSWLPALPSLVEKIGARVGMGHDAPGFGFTDRPNSVRQYTTKSSAEIGSQLLHQELKKKQPSNNATRIALFGHSMGSLATLRMALSLPEEVPTYVVLVAPALGVRKTRASTRTTTDENWRYVLWNYFRSIFLYIPLSYVLKRVVGARNFWRRGLRLAWGDPDRVSDSDVLRFQWPSIGEGWERGLLSFTRAQLSVPSDLTDAQLLERVLARPNTSVHIICGTKDKVVNPDLVQSILKPYPQVKYFELDGQGHDPFEEQVDTFVSKVDEILQDEKSLFVT